MLIKNEQQAQNFEAGPSDTNPAHSSTSYCFPFSNHTPHDKWWSSNEMSDCGFWGSNNEWPWRCFM